MPITGTWKERVSIQSGAQRWGNGWDPIHAQPSGQGRGTAPNPELPDSVDYEIVDMTAPYTTYHDDQYSNSIWGYGPETGTSDRPNYSVTTPEFRGAANYPAFDENGDDKRSRMHGPPLIETTKLNPQEEASAGWTNKESTFVDEPDPSAPSQYEMQTSMTQRDKVRAGSQEPLGRASKYNQPIPSRPGPMKLRTWIDSVTRLTAMFPVQQAFMVRPFWARNAGTGDVQDLAVNDAYQSVPLQRVPPPDPDQGAVMDGSPANFYDSGSWMVSYA
jgi:hypothetical protein